MKPFVTTVTFLTSVYKVFDVLVNWSISAFTVDSNWYVWVHVQSTSIICHDLVDDNFNLRSDW